MKLKVIEAKDAAYNRKILEQNKEIILEGVEYSEKEDSTKYLNSGLNSVITKIAKKNKNSIGINLEKLRILNKNIKARILARIQQNISLCNKTKTNLAIKGTVASQDKRAIIESLGGSTKQGSEAISF